MPITVSDSFNRADTAYGTLGSTNSGLTLPWTVSATGWKILSNTAYNDVSTADAAFITTYQKDSDTRIKTSGFNGIGVAFWVQNTTNFWVAYLYSNRYTQNTTFFTCPPCATTTANTCPPCTDCNTNPTTYSGTRSGSSAGPTVSLSCGSCTDGSCSGSCTCNSSANYTISSFNNCGPTCVNRTVRLANCISTGCNPLGTATTSCVSSCSPGSNATCPDRTCGTRNCGATCGYNSRNPRTCSCICNATPGNQNASAGCTVCPSSVANTGCSGTQTRREYIFRVQRIVNGSVSSTPYSNVIRDTTSTATDTIYSIKVITSGNTYQAIGYSDASFTNVYSSGSNTGVLTSSFSDHTLAVGVGMARMPLGNVTPGIGYNFEDFSATYEPLGGDSVGIIQG